MRVQRIYSRNATGALRTATGVFYAPTDNWQLATGKINATGNWQLVELCCNWCMYVQLVGNWQLAE